MADKEQGKDWKTIVTVTAAAVTALAALISAILGQDGISWIGSLLSNRNS